MTTPATAIPSHLGKYVVLDRLAYGGMAEIFLAREQGVAGLERLVVVKRILPHLAADQTFVEMFLDEARIVARLSHPNVVQIYELGEDAGSYYIAMEYIAGSSVRDLLAQAARQHAPLPLGTAIGIAVQACAGAHAAHELVDPQGQPMGLVHRDISPHNLMVTAEGHVKLLDFGIAKATERARDLTRTGGLKGKLHYLSPEQCQHQRLDRRSDVFALGVVLAELLSGQRLFKHDSELATMQSIVDGTRPDLASLRDGLPGALIEAVDRALAPDRAQRFDSADAFRRALLGVAEQAGIDTGSDALGEVVVQLCGEAQARTRRAVHTLVERATELGEGIRLRAAEDTTGSMPLWKTLAGTGSGTPSRSGSHSGSQSFTATGLADGEARPPRRRQFLIRSAALLGSLAVAAAASWWALRPPPVSGYPLVIGFAPSLEPALLQRELEPLRLYLERRTGRPIRFPVADSYRALGEQLLHGQVPFAFLPPNLYLETHTKDPRVEPRVVARYGGGHGNDGILLVREGSKIQDIPGLRGKRICYSDPASTTGYLLPRARLRTGGVDPDRDLAEQRVSGNHLQAMKDLIAGRCDVMGTYSNAYRTADETGIEVTTLRVLGITGRAPHDAMCAGPGASTQDLARLEQALLDFDPRRDLDQQWLGEVQRITAFARSSDADFAALREALVAERAVMAARKDAGRSEDASSGDPRDAAEDATSP